MANARARNVIFIDSTGTFQGARKVRAVKYYGAITSSVTIREKDSSGTVLWKEDGSGDVFQEVLIESPDGIHVTVTGTAEAHIYLK